MQSMFKLQRIPLKCDICTKLHQIKIICKNKVKLKLVLLFLPI